MLKTVAFDLLTQQLVECVSCSGAGGLWGHHRAKGDISKPLQAGGDQAGKDKQCEQFHNTIQCGRLIFGIMLTIIRSDK